MWFYDPLMIGGVSALCLFVILIVKFCDFRRPGEAPLVGGWIPFLGVALELGKKGFPETLKKYSSSLGDVFTLHILGKRMTFVTKTQVIPVVSKLEASGVLSNFPTRFEIIPMIFGDGECRRDIVQKYWASNETEHVWALFHGSNLWPLTKQFQTDFHHRVDLLIPSASHDEGWRSGKLLDLIASLFLPTTTRLFFGSNAFFQSREYVDVMFAFNDNINALQKGQHPNSNAAFVKAKRKLLNAILNEDALDEKPFEAVQVLLKGMEDTGFNDNEKATTLLSILWASNMNAIISAFWALWYILNDPKASAIIREEIRSVTMSTSKRVSTPLTPRAESSSSSAPILTLEQLRKMVVTESACLEAMRISSANILRTEALRECTIRTSTSETFRVRKGDSVAISTGQIHYDPANFPDPETYKFDRFVSEDGKRCTNTNVMVFSHGKHMCPGRFMAMNELKVLLICIFSRIEIDFTKPLEPKPEIDFSYYGVGSMKPKADVPIRYRMRPTYATLSRSSGGDGEKLHLL